MTFSVVNHVSFTVDSLDQAIGMFSNCLGAKIISRSVAANPRGIPVLTGVADAQVEFAFMQLGNVTVEFVEYLLPREKGTFLPRPCDRGFSHLAVNVDSVDEISKNAKAFGFKQIGGVIEMLGGPDKGKKAVYIRSEDGLTLELIGN
jgi:catechol 2,3-dioxygenase-like lactoylglutathione lyase family enzyme